MSSVDNTPVVAAVSDSNPEQQEQHGVDISIAEDANTLSVEKEAEEKDEEQEVEEKASVASNGSPKEAAAEDDEEYDPLAEYDPSVPESSEPAAPQEPMEQDSIEEEQKPDDEQSEVVSREDEPITDHVDEVKEEEQNDENEIDVVSFNEIVSWFITTPLFQDATFEELKPTEKEQIVLDEYNKTFDKNLKVKLNFNATTSYNKAFLRTNEKKEFLIPMNPFCLRPDLLSPMTNAEKESFNSYMENEDGSLKSGKWDNFPIGSRLFIGNLAVNTLTKQDVFRVFNAYGEIAQVNLKQGFGFVQFQKAETCSRAIQGEKNVPLHNKVMHLEVSKHQIKRAITQQDTSSSTRDRSRSPTRGNNDNVRSRSPVKKPAVDDVKIFLTLDSSPLFEKKLTKRLTQDGISFNVENFEVSFDDVPAEVLTNAAYDGITVVLVTCGNDLLNVTAYESTPDGGIKFDEYTEITIDSSIEIILTAKAKKTADQPREFHLQQRQERERNGRGRNNNNNSNNNDRGDRGRGGKDRDGRRNNNSNNSNNNTRNGNQAIYGGNNRDNNNRDNNRNNNRRGRNNNNDDYNNVRYSKQQRYLQQHAPVQVTSSYNQSSPPPLHQQPQSNQLLQQLSNVDPNTLQSMLSLVQQYQGQPQQQPQRGGNQYYPPQPSNNSGNMQLNGLLSQLQNADPQQQLYGNQNGQRSQMQQQMSLPPQNQQYNQYNHSPPQQPPAHTHAPHHNNSHPSNPLLNPGQSMNNSRGGYNNTNNHNNNENNDQSQSSSDLFETLSRLRNNV